MNSRLFNILHSSLKEPANSLAPPLHLLSPSSGIVSFFINNPPFYDEPKLYGFASILTKSAEINRYNKERAPEISIGFAGGASLDIHRAYWKVIGESVERYALFMYNRESIKCTYNHLTLQKKHALNPEEIYSSVDLKISKTKTRLDWTTGYDLTKNRNCYLPTQMIAVPYWDSGSEKIFRAPITTGAASGVSIKSAIFSGLCEVIERDAFMVAWLRQLKVSRIRNVKKEISSIKTFHSELLSKTILAAERYKLYPEFYLLPNDTQLPTVMCVLKDLTEVGPYFTLGLDTDYDILKSMLGSLEECLQLRPWVRQLFDSKKRKSMPKNLSHIRNLQQRALLWMNDVSIQILDTWLSFSKNVSLKSLLKIKCEENLTTIINKISSCNCNVYFANLTRYIPRAAADSGIKVVKVIIPEYQPLYLIEEYADFVTSRLFTAESRLSCKSTLKDNEVIKFPHPML